MQLSIQVLSSCFTSCNSDSDCPTNAMQCRYGPLDKHNDHNDHDDDDDGGGDDHDDHHDHDYDKLIMMMDFLL